MKRKFCVMLRAATEGDRMKLADWLRRRDMTRAEFADLVGTSAATVSRLCACSVWPERALARRIQAATDGEVTALDFLDPPDEAGEAA